MFRRPAILIAAILAALLIIAVLLLAAFPPSVKSVPVERTLQNDRFQNR
jgi:uncharacterized membrane protein